MDNTQKIIHSLGIHAIYRGYHYLCYALELCLQNEDYILHVRKLLYDAIAVHFGKSRSSVEHALRTVVSACWYNGNREVLNLIAEYTLDSCPPVGEFITILYYYLKRS